MSKFQQNSNHFILFQISTFKHIKFHDVIFRFLQIFHSILYPWNARKFWNFQRKFFSMVYIRLNICRIFMKSWWSRDQNLWDMTVMKFMFRSVYSLFSLKIWFLWFLLKFQKFKKFLKFGFAELYFGRVPYMKSTWWESLNSEVFDVFCGVFVGCFAACKEKPFALPENW